MKLTLLRRLALGSMAVVGALAALSLPAHADTGDATLVVKAVDAKTGAAVTPAFVYVDGGAEAIADGQGQATFTGLAAGSHIVQIFPTDKFHLTASTTVTIAGGVTTTASVPVKKGGKISVTVTDTLTGLPVANACADPMTSTSALLSDGHPGCTDDTGKLTMGPMPPGTYQVLITPPAGSAYGEQWIGATGGTGQQSLAASVVVTASTTVAAPLVHLDRAGVVSGTITDAVTHSTLSDVFITILTDNPGVGAERPGVTTDASGHYTIDTLGPYAWPLLLLAGGHADQYPAGTGNRNHATLATVPATGVGTFDAALKVGVTVSGTVTEAGAPMQNGRVLAYNASTGDIIGHEDFTGGSYSLLLAGSQGVKLVFENFATASPDEWFGGTDLPSAATVNVPSKSPLTQNVTLP